MFVQYVLTVVSKKTSLEKLEKGLVVTLHYSSYIAWSGGRSGGNISPRPPPSLSTFTIFASKDML